MRRRWWTAGACGAGRSRRGRRGGCWVCVSVRPTNECGNECRMLGAECHTLARGGAQHATTHEKQYAVVNTRGRHTEESTHMLNVVTC
eukprot:2102227-Prymnesium_polylepis.2